MKCRRIKKQTNENTIVWFGSYGLNGDGTAKFYNPSDKHDNFADEQEGVRDSLTQRLSVIKNELWYNINYGLPLLEKIKYKAEIDTTVASIILTHENVLEITSFESSVIQHHYSAKFVVMTTFGELELSI